MTSSWVDDPVAVTQEELPLTMATANHILDDLEQASDEILDTVETLRPVRSVIPPRGHELLLVDPYE